MKYLRLLVLGRQAGPAVIFGPCSGLQPSCLPAWQQKPIKMWLNLGLQKLLAACCPVLCILLKLLAQRISPQTALF